MSRARQDALFLHVLGQEVELEEHPREHTYTCAECHEIITYVIGQGFRNGWHAETCSKHPEAPNRHHTEAHHRGEDLR